MIPLRGYSHCIRIGAGSFSRVFRARQEKLDRDVVLKTVDVSRKSTAETVMREARTIAAVQHPSVPAVYDVVQTGRQVVIVMEWIRGIPLSHVKQYLGDEAQYRTIAAWIISAVAHLHACGIAHRDLKPENVIISPDRGVVLVDFGFSVQAHRTGTVGRTLQGTPAYMAPELWSGSGQADLRRADLYALGMLLRSMPGFEDDELIGLLLQTDPVLRPSDAGAFEKEWAKGHEGAEPPALRRDLAAATAHHTAGILIAGVKDLRVRHRMREAYELLTEALSAWPDSPEGLDLLQNVFSKPIAEHTVRRPIVYGAAAVLLIGMLLIAFAAGRHATASREASVLQPGEGLGQNLGRIAVPASGVRHLSGEERLAMKETASADRLEGVLSVKVPRSRGVLYVDGVERSVSALPWMTTTLQAGTHRVEWQDAARRRRAGETVEVPPFATVRLSLERFADD